MPPSQLKRLKASLREQGLVSPQQSKKQRQGAKNHRSKESGELRAAKLDIVREQSNPFNFKIANVPKFAVAGKHDRQKAGTSRPGVAKSLGEEKVPCGFSSKLQSWLTSRHRDEIPYS